MAYVKVRVKVSSPEQPARGEEVELLVDSGAIYMVLPSPMLERLGVKREGREKFQLADGHIIERESGGIRLELGGKVGYTRVVFGEEGDATVLGVIALEELGLKINPQTGQLEPLELLLL